MPIEVAIEDAKQEFGAGQARNRTANAVCRTIPFQLTCQTLAMTWYATAGHDPPTSKSTAPAPRGITARHAHPPSACSASSAASSSPSDLTHLALDRPTLQEIHAIRLAWETAAA